VVAYNSISITCLMDSEHSLLAGNANSWLPRNSSRFCSHSSWSAASRPARKVADSALPQFRKGVSTEADSEKALGAPQSVPTMPDGTRAVNYVGTQAHAKAASYIPVVRLFAPARRTAARAS
jgi:hypothetical protein